MVFYVIVVNFSFILCEKFSALKEIISDTTENVF